MNKFYNLGAWVANINVADQTAHMHRLICLIIVGIGCYITDFPMKWVQHM